MKWYLGLDIAKEKFDACLLDGEGQQVKEKVFKNSLKGHKKLREWLKGYKKAEGRIVLEATGIYGEDVAEYLHGKGYWVAVVNPARIKGYAQSQMTRNKTDKADAWLIADFCRTQHKIKVWEPPSEAERELKALIRHLKDLKGSRQKEKNRLHAQRRSTTVRKQLETHISFIEEQIAEVEGLINQHIDQHPKLKAQHDLLTSIPGLGETTAATILAECGDIRRFDDVRQLVAFAGLNPRVHQSGNSQYTTGISRIGSASLRTSLYMPAVSALRHNPILKIFADRLRASGRLKGKQIVVAVMRKLLHLAYGILKSGQPFDPDFLTKQVAHA